MKRAGRRLLSTVVGTTLALTAPIAAAADGEDSEPWSRGTMMPSIGFGASFGPDIHVIDFGLGFNYFVLKGLGVGLSLSDTILVYREEYKDDFPGIDKTSPTNIVRVIPTLQYIFMRQRRFSPYVRSGVGPVFYNHNRGTIGEWVVGAGAYIGVARNFAISLGVDFFGNFPDDKWKDAFQFMGQSTRGCAITDTPCSFNISPRLGLVIMFGGGGGKRKKRKRDEAAPEEEPQPTPFPEMPLEEPPPEEPPPEEPPPSEEPPPEELPPSEPLTETPPAETPPAETPPAETPPAEAPPAEAPPAETPPAETPPAEAPTAETPPAEAPV